jgi:hypothetical protein
MKEIKIYEIPNIDFIERIDDPYIGMIFYVADIDAYYSVKTLKEINGINMKGSKVVEYIIGDYADFGTGSGGGSGLTATQLSNIAKIPAIQSTVDALPNNYASKDHNHSEYASSSHRHDASEIDNLPSGGGSGEGLTSTQKQQLQTAYQHSQSDHVTMDEVNAAISNAQLGGGEIDTTSFATDLSLTGSNLQLKNSQGNLIGNAITLPSTSGGASETVTVVRDIYANNEMPKMYVTSDGLARLASKADGTADCEVEIRFNRQIIKCYATGAIQGTSSAVLPAKNYTFKFYSDAEHTIKNKIDVGWGKQSKYCFKKNYIDSTHTRNISGARIAYDMVNSRPESNFKNSLLTAPRNGAVDGFPCKVYINGEFWGLYTWNIPKDPWMFNMSDDNPNHMVLCAEYNNNGDNNQNNTCEFRALWRGESDTNWSIEVGTYSETLKNSFNNAISHVMNSSDEDFKTNFSNYFDLYSILDYYCFSYLTAHIDGLAKNMLMATYDGIHWGACLYDMDSIYGANWDGKSFKNTNIRCPEEYCETNSLLWQRIVTNFSQELHDRYFELRNGALSLGNIVNHVEEIYDLIPDRVLNDERQKWGGIPSQATNTMTRFRNYMRDRAAYCDERFKELILDKSVTSVTISGKSEVKIGSSITLTANLTPSIADVKTGSWSASNANVTLDDSNSLSVVVNGSVLGSSTITFVSDDTTNGTISAAFDVTVVEKATAEMDSTYSYLRVTVPASATSEQSTLYLSKPTNGVISSLYINDVSKDVPTGTNGATTSYSLNEGENIIKIKGNFTCYNSKCNINVLQLQNDLNTCSNMFFGCTNITFNATIPATVTNTNSMFKSSGLVNGVDIPSSVTNTGSMYQYDAALKTPSTVPDSVIFCSTMYGGCSSLQGIVNVSNSATDISSYLSGAGTNGEGISVIGINTSSVTNYNEAFYNSKVTTIEQSFADLIKQAKPETVTKAVCFRTANAYLSSPITIAEVHSDWKI